MTNIRDRIKGSITALITPMKDGKVDEAAFRKLVDWQIAEGTHGLVPCGTTGESPTLSHDEHKRVIEICVEEAKGRVPVIAGAGSNSTDEAIALTRHAKEVGCDAVLSVTGYYNKPTQEGSIATSWRSPTRWTSRSSSTTFPAAPLSRSRSRPWRGWPSTRTSSG